MKTASMLAQVTINCPLDRTAMFSSSFSVALEKRYSSVTFLGDKAGVVKAMGTAKRLARRKLYIAMIWREAMFEEA